MIHAPKSLQPLLRFIVENRLPISLGLSAACGIILRALVPVNNSEPILQMILIQRPLIHRCFVESYQFFLFSTPFLAISILLSMAYVHLYAPESDVAVGLLPPYPDPLTREDLYLVVGEIHQRMTPKPSPMPTWLVIPERGLYTGIAAIGAIGSGKTQALILPAMQQLFAYKADDPMRRLSGIVLEVKGDLCRKLRQILDKLGRGSDYVEVSLDSDIRYNPLHNDLDPYAQAFNIASIITSIWGKGKEPFWQQSYTDLARYVIMLHQVRDHYVTMVDVYRTVISEETLERMMIEVAKRYSTVAHVVIDIVIYKRYEVQLKPFGFLPSHMQGYVVARWSEALERVLVANPAIVAYHYGRPSFDPAEADSFESISYWYWEHWKFFRSEVKSSITQGIVVFLSLFDTDPAVKRVFCPPKALYEGSPCVRDPRGQVLQPFDELIESGKVVGLKFPVALNPALSKIIGTMMKVDYQRAVQLRIPKMDAHPERHFRPTVFICDEYQNFATVGGDNPTGDERFFSLSRQPRCIPIVATQSLASLKDALPNEGVNTLLQALRTKIFLTTADPDTARYGSEICGKTYKTRISYTVSESSNNANVGLLSGRTSASKGSVSASKQYQMQKEPVFEEQVFLELKNAQAIITAFDGISPLPPTYCYLKPAFLPITMSWFTQASIDFEPKRLPL